MLSSLEKTAFLWKIRTFLSDPKRLNGSVYQLYSEMSSISELMQTSCMFVRPVCVTVWGEICLLCVCVCMVNFCIWVTSTSTFLLNLHLSGMWLIFHNKILSIILFSVNKFPILTVGLFFKNFSCCPVFADFFCQVSAEPPPNLKKCAGAQSVHPLIPPLRPADVSLAAESLSAPGLWPLTNQEITIFQEGWVSICTSTRYVHAAGTCMFSFSAKLFFYCSVYVRAFTLHIKKPALLVVSVRARTHRGRSPWLWSRACVHVQRRHTVYRLHVHLNMSRTCLSAACLHVRASGNKHTERIC